MNRPDKRRVSLILAIGLHLGLSVGLPQVDDDLWRVARILDLILLGAVWSQPVLVAVWLALSPAPWRVRVPGALATGLLLFFAWVTSEKTVRAEHFDGGGWLQMLGLLVVISSLFAVLLALGRIKFGWQIVGTDRKESAITGPRHQFALRDLLLWTAGVAAALCMGKYLFLPADFQYVQDFISFAAFLLAAILISIPSLACLGILLHRGRRLAWLVVTALAAVAAPLVINALVAIDPGDFVISFPDWDILLEAFCIESGVCLGVFASLGLLAAGGWRLESGCDKTEPAAANAGAKESFFGSQDEDLTL